MDLPNGKEDEFISFINKKINGWKIQINYNNVKEQMSVEIHLFFYYNY